MAELGRDVEQRGLEQRGERRLQRGSVRDEGRVGGDGRADFCGSLSTTGAMSGSRNAAPRPTIRRRHSGSASERVYCSSSQSVASLPSIGRRDRPRRRGRADGIDVVAVKRIEEIGVAGGHAGD